MIYAWNHMLLPYQAVTSFLQEILTTKALQYYHCVNALSGCYLISTALQEISTAIQETCVNALSGCYLISTESMRMYKRKVPSVCQCPLGLLPHFYKVHCLLLRQ